MSNDLISRSALIKRFKQLQGVDTLANMFISEVVKEIKRQPTAYDPDAVKEKLEKRLEDSKRAWITFDDEDAFGEQIAYGHAIEIVEKGGVDG